MRWMVLLVIASACGDDTGAGVDGPLDHDAPIDASAAMTLQDTGLCADAACTQIASGVLPYRPRFELWSDTAVKRRWISLPPGTQIDTSDMDHWQFPVGTKLWKEFSRDGVRVETRLITRTGTGTTLADWTYATYVWNQAQDANAPVPAGMLDANGTAHDVPTQAQCRSCHENLKPSRVLGFGAIQLDFDNTTAGELDLADLVAMNLLTNPPSGSAPYFPLPTEGTGTAQPALGYLHANCGHCHNPSSSVYTIDTQMVLRLGVTTLGSVDSTPTYTTTVNVAGAPAGGRSTLAAPGMPDQSILIYRFETTTANERMPTIGTEMMDPTGAATLRAWIANM